MGLPPSSVASPSQGIEFHIRASQVKVSNDSVRGWGFELANAHHTQKGHIAIPDWDWVPGAQVHECCRKQGVHRFAVYGISHAQLELIAGSKVFSARASTAAAFRFFHEQSFDFFN